AWDAGCGNGQASVALADFFDEVFASDPSSTQIASAAPHPNIRYAVASAEQCSLPDNSADCACVAQALHWFEFERFFSEAKRVLKPGGLLAVWTYERSSVDTAVDAVSLQLYRGILDDYWPPERRHVEAGYRDIVIPFEEIQCPAFQLRCDWTLPQYLAYLRSWSASQRYLKATGIDAIGLIEADMQTAWGNPSYARPVVWPLNIRAGRFL
ncbi:MAG: class I SAM-dependent methyltransferase, partial [Arenimonas sp.]